MTDPPDVANAGASADCTEHEPGPERALAVASGASSTTDDVFPLVYAELRRLANRHLSRERPGQTLQPTALVHEAYLRLCGDREQSWESRAHFFGAAARAIRRILLDRARARRRLRRGGDARRVSLDCGPLGLDVADSSDDTARLDLVALDDALERLALIDPDSARVVELRFFGGLSSRETALSLGISESTEARAWRFARIWLHRELCGDASP